MRDASERRDSAPAGERSEKPTALPHHSHAVRLGGQDRQSGLEGDVGLHASDVGLHQLIKDLRGSRGRSERVVCDPPHQASGIIDDVQGPDVAVVYDLARFRYGLPRV